MTVSSFRVSERGQMALPADARRRWNLSDGGSVDIVDLGTALVIVPSDHGGMRGMLGNAIDDAGGYGALVAKVVADEPDLA